MPVYEYQCRACSRDFEYQQRMTDPDKTTCEACGGALERLISRTAFSLKGGGWYKDLYASPKPEKAGGEAKTDGAAAGADKPAAKSDAGTGTSTSSDGAGSSTSGAGSTSSDTAAKAS
jgi:putative FmdB family regulatory protein